MEPLSEHNILMFLIQLTVLLGLARGLGELFRRWGQPTITAEILVGVLLGATVLGRLAPQFHGMLFPPDAAQRHMLDTFAWIGILFFMLDAGLDTNFATAWRQRGPATILSFSDLILPMAIAFVPCLFMPRRYVGEDGTLLAFALFVGAIMTISALPVTAKIIQELKVYRTDIGLLIMSALTINDVAGWVVFALILGFFTDAVMTIGTIAFVLLATLIFATVSLTLGPVLFDAVLRRLRRLRVPEPAASLTLVCLAGFAGGAVTTWIGIHALFGFFIAGIMTGESDLIPERTKRIFSEMVHAVLVPVFFASIALRLDFIGDFDLLLVLFIFGIGVFGRYIGAYLGGRFIRQPHAHSKFIALAHIPGGQMQIVIGMLALEYAVITETVFVAIVFGAVASSMIAGPGMKKILRQAQKRDWLLYIPVDQFLPDLKAEDRDTAIAEICGKVAMAAQGFSADDITAAVIERERQMTTALDGAVAFPHARLPGLERPVVMVARSAEGLDWNSSDGLPVQLIFLALTPEGDPDAQIQIARGIAEVLEDERVCKDLIRSEKSSEMLEKLRNAANRAPQTGRAAG